MKLRIACLFAAFVLVSACGQTGDLYLPEREEAPEQEEDGNAEENRE